MVERPVLESEPSCGYEVVDRGRGMEGGDADGDVWSSIVKSGAMRVTKDSGSIWDQSGRYDHVSQHVWKLVLVGGAGVWMVREKRTMLDVEMLASVVMKKKQKRERDVWFGRKEEEISNFQN